VNDGGSSVTGTVTADGRLSLGGSSSIFGDLDFDTRDVILSTLQIRTWESSLVGPGVMSGRWSEHLALFTFRVGTADTENELVTMTQTSKSARAASTMR
jgi:hypothetical protein